VCYRPTLIYTASYKKMPKNDNNNNIPSHPPVQYSDVDLTITSHGSNPKTKKEKKSRNNNQAGKPSTNNNNNNQRQSGSSRSAWPAPQYKIKNKPNAYPTDDQLGDYADIFKAHNAKYSELHEEIVELRNQLIGFKKNMMGKDLPPLATIGYGLSGAAARTMQSLVYPVAAPATPLPGQKPGSCIQCDQVFGTSVDLDTGLGSVIGTPFGRYQCYTSTNKAPDGTAQLEGIFGVDGWDPPNYSTVVYETGVVTMVHQYDGQTGTNNAGAGYFKVYGDPLVKPDDYLTISCTNTNGTYSQSAYVFSNTSLQQCLFRYWLEDDQGAPVSNGAIQLNSNETLAWRFTNDLRPNSTHSIALLNPAQGVTESYRLHVNIDHPVGQRVETRYFIVMTQYLPPLFATDAGGFVLPMKYKPMVPDCTYRGQTFSALTGLAAGGQLKDGKFMSLMCLLSDDAGTLNNSGNIIATTFDESAWPPNGQNPVTHASASLIWKYIDKLRDGSYQIYIPDLENLVSIDGVWSNPWTTGQAYCMTNYFDYMGVDGNPPAKLAIRIRMAGSFLTPQLLEFVRPVVFPEDSSFRLCLSLLRAHYNPCCNPDHIKEAQRWLTNVFNGVFQHAKTFIKASGPEIIKRLPQIVEAAAPLALAGLAAL